MEYTKQKPKPIVIPVYTKRRNINHISQTDYLNVSPKSFEESEGADEPTRFDEPPKPGESPWESPRCECSLSKVASAPIRRRTPKMNIITPHTIACIHANIRLPVDSSK